VFKNYVHAEKNKKHHVNPCLFPKRCLFTLHVNVINEHHAWYATNWKPIWDVLVPQEACIHMIWVWKYDALI